MKYEVYVNPLNGDLKEEAFIKVAETDILDAGYNTIYFDDTIMLTGKKFAVAVKYINPYPQTNSATIGVQTPKKVSYLLNGDEDSKIVYENDPYWRNATSSYLSQMRSRCRKRIYWLFTR